MSSVRVRFVFVGEGSSDLGLNSLLEELCYVCGATEVAGNAPRLDRLPTPPGKTIVEQVECGLRLVPDANLIFIHRDSDSRDPSPRYDDMALALESCPIPHVGVVPVQELEAWLLLDEEAIRRVAGRPNSRVPLDVPSPERVEELASPKEHLNDLLLRASETTGRKRKR